jgi:predicted  nucleic acid-binding Zn-ribbon protein
VVPLPLTDLIEQELLATLEGEGTPEAVLERYAGSKGPLYAALARATVRARSRLAELHAHVQEARTKLRQAEQMARDAQHRAAEAERRARAAEQRLATAEAALAQRQGLLQRAEALYAAGFDEQALAGLGEALAAAARAEGRPAAEIVAAFLQAAADWRTLAELRSQVAAARRQAEEAEAQAKARMVEARLTERAVRAARWLLRRKVPTAVVEAWQAVAAKLGLADADLATGLARALEEHGRLEAARRAWTEAVAKLRAEHRRLTAEVAALRAEREGLAAAIAAVREAGIAKVQEVADAATAEVRRAAAEFQRLAAEAVELGEYVALARALANRDPEAWRAVQPETWAGLLARLLDWAEARLVGAVEVEAPEPVKGLVEEQVRYPYTKGPMRLTVPQLVTWLLRGLRTPVLAVLPTVPALSPDGSAHPER